MKCYTNILAAIVALYRGCIATYHRIIGTTQAEYAVLKARLEALEANVVADADKFKAELEAKDRQIVALESMLTTDLSKHLEAIKHLAATKRESPNVQGQRPELLR